NSIRFSQARVIYHSQRCSTEMCRLGVTALNNIDFHKLAGPRYSCRCRKRITGVNGLNEFFQLAVVVFRELAVAMDVLLSIPAVYIIVRTVSSCDNDFRKAIAV